MAGENINRRLNIYVNDKEVVNSMTGINRAINTTRNQIRNLDKSAADYDVRLKELKATYAKLTAEQAKFKAEIAETPTLLGRIKGALGPIATGMIAAFSVQSLVNGFISKIKEAWQTVLDFDQKQADLAAIMQKSRIQIAGLTADALKYGATTAYTAANVSELQTELARLGKTAPEIKAMTKDVLNAATALETDLGSAATLIGGQLNSYGESANKAGKYSDIMANSVNISATSYESLATALPKVSKVAALNGVTFEKLNAILGVLADETIANETAGTSFRNILLQSSKAGKPYTEMLEKVRTAADQGKKAMELFGTENATVAVILANSTEKINFQTKALENSAGSAEALAKEKMNSIIGSTKLFSSAWEGFILSIEKGDGVISKSIRGLIDLGSSFLGLITPMKKVSDQLEEEQLGLNMLVSKITSTNLKNDERKKLLIELQEQYPDFIKNINIETVSNNDLNTSLNKVNEQYINRIALQKQVEKIESKQNDAAFDLSRKLEVQERLFKRLNQIKIDKKLEVNIDYSNLEKSGKAAIAELQKRGIQFTNAFSDIGKIRTDIAMLNSFNKVLKDHNNDINEETAILNRQQKVLGLNTEAQNEKNKAIAAEAEALKKVREEAKGLGMKTAMTAPEQEVKMWIAAYKEKRKYSGELSEEERKKREKAIEDAKKHSADLKKELGVSQKELLQTTRSFQDSILAGQKESYDKELTLLNQEYDRKIEDSKIKVAQLQAEITKLGTDAKDPKNSKSDVKVINSTIANKIAEQKEYGKLSVSIEETRLLKIATLQEKYLQKSFQDQETKNARDLQNLKTKQTEELNAVKTLEDAKTVLQQYLSDDELSKVKSLSNAKKEIKKQFLKEEFDLQQQQLNDIMAMAREVLGQTDEFGIQLISGEERDKIIKFLDDAAAKLAALGVKDPNAKDNNELDLSTLSGIDILGFSPEQWESAFENLDKFDGKMKALQLTVAAVQNAFGMYFQFLDAGEKKQTQKAEAAYRKRTAALANQLENGFITQEVYNARMAKADQELAKKKAEIEYKQAKREKAMKASAIITNTAMGIMQIWAHSPDPTGISQGLMTAIISGIGGANLGLVLAQPLPDKKGFYDGGFTGDGNPRSESTALGVKDYTYHKGEYVVPNDVLFSNDPVVPNIVGYLEAKRTGKTTSNSNVDTAPATSSSQSNSTDSGLTAAVVLALDRNSDLIEDLIQEGVIAYLENDIPAARKMRDKIKEANKLDSNAKA